MCFPFTNFCLPYSIHFELMCFTNSKFFHFPVTPTVSQLLFSLILPFGNSICTRPSVSGSIRSFSSQVKKIFSYYLSVTSQNSSLCGTRLNSKIFLMRSSTHPFFNLFGSRFSPFDLFFGHVNRNILYFY